MSGPTIDVSRLAAGPSINSTRLTSLDLLRGTVMVVMALDHTRDFFHRTAMVSSPTDLAKTTVSLFLTRWVTHFCLPVFMFLAGVSAYLWWQRRGHTRRELSRFLWTRGVWFVLLELTLMQFAYNFNFSARIPILLLILWIFGLCMLALAALIYLPRTWLLAASLAAIALHNLLDGISAKRFGAAAPIWLMLHQPGLFTLSGRSFLVTYTLLPWIAVIAAGFCFGPVMEWESLRRQKFLRRLGLSLIAGFLALRFLNIYGDPVHWESQGSAAFTLLSFLNCTKYPASLDFLLMTLGPALLALSYFERWNSSLRNPLVVFGRVPMFYFVLHFYLIHAFAVFFAFLRYGSKAAGFAFNPPPSMGAPAGLFPPNYGYGLSATYCFWLLVVIASYPLCRWFARFRANHRYWWLSYL
jgi:uncharacterized membrane protein